MSLYRGVALARNDGSMHYCEAVTWFYAQVACMTWFKCEAHEVDVRECTDVDVRRAIEQANAQRMLHANENVTIAPSLLARFAPKRPKRKR